MLVPIRIDNGIFIDNAELIPASFKELGLMETHIEEFLRKNIDVLFDDETLLIVGQQVSNVERGRSDLVAVDESGNIVLIEIKRDAKDITNRKEPFEFQAIRYAASFATIQTPEELVDRIFASYIEKKKNEYDLGELTPNEKGRRILNDFLKSNYATKTFNKKQRIILIASTFDTQTLSAVAWLINNDVHISCFGLTPLKMDGKFFLQIEKILPPPRIEGFFCDILEKNPSIQYATETSETTRTNLPRMPKLFEWGILTPGDILTIKDREDSEAEVVDAKQVRFKGDLLTYNQWGKSVTGWSSICIYEWAIHPQFGKTLDQLREERLNITLPPES
jgi:hypothetical protein